ncbi:Glycoside hydrolase, family 35 [Sesbania bispinosa]|nr:Glycoside hydrolase, family 35 [Sesbania bispinosa]
MQPKDRGEDSNQWHSYWEAIGNSVYLTTYTNNATGEKFCFLSNSHNSQDAEVDLQQDGKYYVPAWSVSILQDCKKEVFNTAKVNTQTTVYVKKPATEGNPLKWKFVINDTSSWQNATLHVTQRVMFFTPMLMDNNLVPTGANLTTSTWSYKVGLNGEAKRFYDPKFPNGVQWNTNSVPTGRPMTWYKTTFETPEGTDSLVLDLEGLGKGHAWVNGKSIGRYWPTMVADENGCSDTCDYRGNYGPERCVSGCGEPSQRFYHVPRSFLKTTPTH